MSTTGIGKGCVVALVVLATGAGTVMAQDHCGTLWMAQREIEAIQARGGDPPLPTGSCTLGPCDDAGIRDGWAAQGQNNLEVRVVFVVFAYDDGSYPAISSTDLAEQFATLNEHFLPYKIQFVQGSNPVQIDDSEFRILNLSTVDEQMYCQFLTEYEDMKDLYAQSPGTQLNIFVTTISDPCGHFAAWGSFPWGPPDPLSERASIVIDANIMGELHTDLAHEVGHNLGLWHTFNGNCRSELEFHGGCPSGGTGVDCDVTSLECGCTCYEEPGGAYNNMLGDMCSDTPPTPRLYNCVGLQGQELCSGNDWDVQTQNFMSYSNAPGDTSCRDTFTAQQVARMNCWTCDKLRPWIVGETDPGACCIPDGGCVSTGQKCCEHRGGTFRGVSTTCSGTTGACCGIDGECDNWVDSSCCTAAGGAFRGESTTCSTGAVGRCCLVEECLCLDTTESCCDAHDGEGWSPANTCETPGVYCWCEQQFGPPPPGQ